MVFEDGLEDDGNLGLFVARRQLTILESTKETNQRKVDSECNIEQEKVSVLPNHRQQAVFPKH